MKTSFSKQERRITTLSALIFALRLFGLFMILPVFTLYAKPLANATPENINFTLGLYGLAAFIFQPLFGALSDRFGRKPMVAIGLSIFVIGCLIATLAHNIYLMMLGRLLQGGGSIGSVLMALVADYTRESLRTRAMALIGITLTLSFVASIVLSPILVSIIQLNGLFAITTFLGVIGLILTVFLPSEPPTGTDHIPISAALNLFLKNQDILILNISVLLLHAILIAIFTTLPILLGKELDLTVNGLWTTYLPTLLIAFVGMIVLIMIAERYQKMKQITTLSIALIVISSICFWFGNSYLLFFIGISVFFTGFITLEALLPSWLTRVVPQSRKGVGMGAYSMMQFLGAFLGGCLGATVVDSNNIFLYCIATSGLWFILAMKLKRLPKTPAIPGSIPAP